MKLDEWLYDMDRPADLDRELRKVGVTVPCVAGPYTNVNCRLTLTGNAVRVKDGGAAYGNPLSPDNTDDRFVSNPSR